MEYINNYLNSNSQNKHKIDFVWSSDKELSCLKPLYQYMVANGWSANLYKIYKHSFRNWNTLKKISNLVILCFDLPLIRLKKTGWNGEFIYVDHGLSPVKYYAYKYDFFLKSKLLFYPGPVFQRKMELLHPHFKNGLLGGLPKMDTLINSSIDKKEICNFYGLNPNESIILFAPSWGGKYNKDWGIHNARHIIDIPNLIISPHPADLKFAKKYNAVIPKNHSTTELLKIADVVVSDISSIIGEAAILDISIVQIKLPHFPGCFPEKDKRKSGIAISQELIDLESEIVKLENRPFKVAYLDEDWILGNVSSPESLKQNIINALKEPDKFKKKRQYWANECCWKADGKTSERIAKMIEVNLS